MHGWSQAATRATPTQAAFRANEPLIPETGHNSLAAAQSVVDGMTKFMSDRQFPGTFLGYVVRTFHRACRVHVCCRIKLQGSLTAWLAARFSAKRKARARGRSTSSKKISSSRAIGWRASWSLWCHSLHTMANL